MPTAPLTDDYLNYLNVSGLLDEGRVADRSASHRPTRLEAWPEDVGGEVAIAPGERWTPPGGGDVTEPLLSPGDLYGPIAAKLGRETADLLVPYLMQSVSRMAPMLGEAQTAARRALRNQRGSLTLPWHEQPEPLPRSEQELQALYEWVKAHMNRDITLPRGEYAPKRLPGEDLQSWDDALSKYETRYKALEETPAYKQEAAEKVARQQREDERWAGTVAEEQRVNPYAAGQGPPRRVIELDAPAPPDRPTGDAKQYENIIRRLFEAGGR